MESLSELYSSVALQFNVDRLRKVAHNWYVDPEEANLAIIHGRNAWRERKRDGYDTRFRDSQ